ncbi:xanthine dehydrogenase family protein molybdopterin-binding subunit [Salipiger marinus]|uniref:Carbon-monoxide dehydrogenase large subunit n=1 Tax=Salipiger marinus TaxID=555512 RepID=A0A1G8M525_9RHOB|nr:xanthine dehydrogenase family protein molybdopterin-binding subunit [Salipiger marinus]SDI62995.1 carbon-monoxide dehydrogenase large subunit [Salipiger marinus]
MTQSNAPLVGQSVPRREDRALVSGKGRFLDDIASPGGLHAAFLRSPYAHARIGTADLEEVRAMPGVVAVYTARDLAALLPGGQRLVTGLPSSSIAFALDRPILPEHETVYVGEALAMVVAETRAEAEDAAEMIDLDLDPLEPVADLENAARHDAPKAHAHLPHNRLARFGFSYGDIAAAFDGAPHVMSRRFRIDRGGAHSMEGRGVLAAPDAMTGRLSVWSSTQTPHALKRHICTLLARDDAEVEVTAPDLGGAFGPKLVTYPEEIAVAAAAQALGRPVRWVEDRREHFLAACQEREQLWTVEMALEADGRIRGLRGTLLHDHGAWTARGLNVPYASGMMLPLMYEVPAYDLDIIVTVTNKTPVTPVRGAGQPQATYVMERLLDAGARACGIDRAEIRRRNLVTPDRMPCERPLKLRSGEPVILDSGDYPRTQATALEGIGWHGFEDRRREARARGKRLGLGLANYVEGTGRGPYETVTIRVARDGRIKVNTGAAAMGQGVGTALAQIVAEHLGRDPSTIDLTLGDTREPYGFGGFNSRQTVVAGASADAAARVVRRKVLQVAAHLLQMPEENLDIAADLVIVAGSNSGEGLSLAEIAAASEGLPGYRLPGIDTPGLQATERVLIEGMAFANGCLAAEVEVDEATGAVHVARLFLAHDCGRMVNPQMVDGQILGGLAHGLGNALYEKMCFDDQAQPLTASLADYLLVTSAEMPVIEIAHTESPSPLNALGVKGVGESGVIPTAAAIASAVEHALEDLGIEISEAPISVQALHAAIRAARPGGPE